MPGFTIHIAVAKQYLNKHKGEIINEEDFIKGAVAPDLDETLSEISKNKNKSHYGTWHILPVVTNIDMFLNDSYVDINNDYWKGYLLHLLTDFYFYNKIFLNECLKMKNNNDNIYYDYDCLNNNLIEKYQIIIFENIKKYVNFIEGTPKYLDKDKIISFIEKISNLNLDDQIKIILEKGMEGLN